MSDTLAADPALADEAHVPAAAVAEYREKGHTCLRGLATPAEVERYRPAIERAALDLAWDKRPLAERDTYGKAFLQSANLWKRGEGVAGFALARRFASAAAKLMGVEGVRMYHDQALFKEPGGGHTPWHQDQNYWPLDTDHTITMWMPLVDIPAEVGSMTFADGTHRHGDLGPWTIGDESHDNFGALVEREGWSTTTHGAMRAGDATFHSGWTLHSAGPNPTAETRAVMTVIYYADGTRIGPIDAPQKGFDQKLWLGGLEPGEPAAGPLNPLLYP